MAAVAPPSDQAADLLQKLSLDPQTKTGLEVPEPTKKPSDSATQYTPVNSDVLLNGLSKPFERSTTPVQQDIMDPSLFYSPNGYSSTPYYYEGYDGSVGKLDDYSRYVYPDGLEGVYGDNGSLMYQHGYSYAPYGAYPPPGSPVPSMGHDAQLYGPQHYQYPTSYYHFCTTNGQSYPPNQSNAPKAAGVSTSLAADQVALPVESKANVGSANGTTKSLRPNYQNSSLNSNASYGRGASTTGITSSGYEDPRFSSDGIRSPNPWFDASTLPDGKPKHAPVSHGNNFSAGRNQNIRPFSHFMGLQHPRSTAGIGQVGFMNRMYPTNKMYGQYANSFRSGAGFGYNSYDARINGRGLLAVDNKYKPRGRGNGSFSNENVYGLNELNRGPRAKTFKDQKGDNKDDHLLLIPDKEQYNKKDFPETYSEAKFFIIKSYSEDDVHKSIKYNVWASTPNGNKKLESAYQEGQTAGGSSHPVFLLFSVNASGQFVGIAEMVGPVDFNKSLEYWQQDKWTGCFPLKWHIVKDVPNSLLKHITLENNENKPVTNSRDTQEVKFEQGIQILKIFKDHSSKTCILDDFQFYEGRQKIMQQQKAKQQKFSKQQVGNVKPIDTVVVTDAKDRDGLIVENGLQKSLEIASEGLIEASITATTETVETTSVAVLPSLEENGHVATAEDASKAGSN